MARRERIYQGEIETPTGQAFVGELWSNGTVAIVFQSPWNRQLAVLRDPVVGMVGAPAAERLSVTGVNEESGDEETWIARPTEQVILNWMNGTIRYPDGTTVEGATVQATQYRVTVLKAGVDTRVFVGATATELYGKRVISTAEGESIIVETKGGCGCGG